MSKKEKKPRKFRPIKFIFSIIGILVAIILLIPVVLLLLMFDWGNYQPPVADFEAQSSFIFTDFIAERISNFIDDDTEYIDISISTPEINAALINMFRNDNPNYLVEGEDYDPFFREVGIIGLKGVTATIADDSISIEAGATAQLLSWLNFRVRLRVDVGFVADDNGIRLQIQRLNVSNLPLRSMYGMASTIMNWFGIDLPGMLDGLIPIGTFDSTNLSWAITYPELFDLIPDSGDSDMINLLSQLATQTFGADKQRLFNIGLAASDDDTVRGTAAIKLNMGLFRTPNQSPTLTHVIQDDTELEALFQGQISNMLISSLTSDAGTLNLDLTQDVLNQIVRYKMGDHLIQDFDLTLGDRHFVITSEPIFIELLDNDQVTINLFLEMYESIRDADGNETGRSTGTFRTVFTLNATVSLADSAGDDQDIMFSINNISIADNALTQDMIVQLVNIVNNDMLTLDANNQARLIISGFGNEILEQGVSIDAIHSSQNLITFVVTPEDTEISGVITQVQQHLPNALDQLQNDPNLAGGEFEAVQTAVSNLVGDINNPDAEADPTAVLDAVNNLDPADQKKFFDSLTGALQGEGIDLSSLIPGVTP